MFLKKRERNDRFLASARAQISNEDRYRILSQLMEEPMNVTRLSKGLDLSLTETSRHISRLSDELIINRDSKGKYHPSDFGKALVSQLKGLKFVSNHREYFNSHTMDQLPDEFRDRLGELEHGKVGNDIAMTFFNIGRMMKEAEEYFWNITDHYLMSTIPLVKRVAYEGLKARSIDQKGYVFPPEMKETVLEEEIIAAYEAKKQGNIEMRVLDKIDVFLWMSEKEVAALAFPSSDGRFDYMGFTSKEESIMKWCRDLFLYYWKKAEPKPEFSLYSKP